MVEWSSAKSECSNMTNEALFQRKFPVGAEVLPTGGVHFRLWAPDAHQVTLILEDPSQRLIMASLDMLQELQGYWSCFVPDAETGMLYHFQLNQQDHRLPDPVSRFQPCGPHGVSQIIDCGTFNWTDHDWKGIAETQRVIYEMHIGTFTREGTYRAAAAELPELARLGITVIELMPLAEFNGEFGWGYDGVTLFAPFHHYGTPNDLRYFIDRAHALGISVILDVVYNHCGTNGCYLPQFSQSYFTDRYACEWGNVFNFDGENAEPVREFVITNAVYWITEFHFDGFRLDATQQIFDASSEHIIAALVREARNAAGDRDLFIVGENEPQDVRVMHPISHKGYGLDGVWNDDFHHSAKVRLKGRTEAYFVDYKGEPQEFISAMKRGFLYQGQWYRWQKKRRGTPTSGIPLSNFIHFIENHDQIANTGLGKRIHEMTSPGLYRAFTALLLLGPATPMLFQGQEFCASTPFLYFADHPTELAELVRQGRKEFLHQFPSQSAQEMQNYLSLPDDPRTFFRCQLNLAERDLHHTAYVLHQDLLKLRREDPLFSQQHLDGLDGAVISPTAFVLRFFSADGISDRLLLINCGRDLSLSPIPEPLLAPHKGCDWRVLWSSEHPRYGGSGTGPIHTDERWQVPACSALVFVPDDRGDIQHA